jgi:hypothetical protein
VGVQCAVCSSRSSSSNFTNLSTLCGFLTHQVHHQIKEAHCKQIIFQTKKLSSSNSCYQFHHQLHDQILYWVPMFFKIHHKKFLYSPMFLKIHDQKFFNTQCFPNSSSNSLNL